MGDLCPVEREHTTHTQQLARRSDPSRGPLRVTEELENMSRHRWVQKERNPVPPLTDHLYGPVFAALSRRIPALWIKVGCGHHLPAPIAAASIQASMFVVAILQLRRRRLPRS